MVNQMKISFPSLSVNESTARAVVAAFVAQADPTVSELADIKCAVSEAVTNSVFHGYPDTLWDIYISVQIFEGRLLRIEIKDKGKGIEDVQKAIEPLFTTAPESERSGLGFTVMQSFTDKMNVRSKPEKGTSVVLFKQLRSKNQAE
ncbi:MAG: anti-sigma F factor [Clostridia bacterium]|nr:anti-sigma F factor [Clostridia bacterium]